jgi:hypothetical protein
MGSFNAWKDHVVEEVVCLTKQTNRLRDGIAGLEVILDGSMVVAPDAVSQRVIPTSETTTRSSPSTYFVHLRRILLCPPECRLSRVAPPPAPQRPHRIPLLDKRLPTQRPLNHTITSPRFSRRPPTYRQTTPFPIPSSTRISAR